MANTQILRGMTTVSYYADDMLAARAWYSELLGIEAYFQRPNEEIPAYIECRIDDYQHELGIVDRKYAPKGSAGVPGGAILFWAVDNLEAALERVKSMGATEYEPQTVRGDGFVTASVVDPFGNVLGLMYNKHYLEMVDSLKKA